MNIEPLESRIAPAGVFTYTDFDGDQVTITSSKGTNADLAAAGVLTFSVADPAMPRELWKVDLSINAAFDGTNLTVTAKRDPVLGGDGLAHVGAIDASTEGGGVALDLGAIKIGGDLGQIDAGDGDATPGVKSITAKSMGRLGLFTQGNIGDLRSTIAGHLGTLSVAGDMLRAAVDAGSMGAVTIGGSLTGEQIFEGQIRATGAIGAVKIGGDLIGGTGDYSGLINSVSAKIASVTIGGSVIGSSGFFTGAIHAVTLGPVKVGGSLIGGSGANAGAISTSAGAMGAVTIGGSVIGGAANGTGEILSAGSLGVVKVGVDLVGGSGSFGTGRIKSFGTLAGVTIGGSVIGGSMVKSGVIESTGPDTAGIGFVKIGENLQGGAGLASGYIEVSGNLASLTIGGSILGNSALAGAVFASGDLRSVKIGGDVKGGSIKANSEIKSLTIGGSFAGGSGNGSGYIQASKLGAVNIGGDIVGGSGESSANIAGTSIASLAIGGSLRGGSASNSGLILSGGTVGSIKIAGDITGGDVTTAVSIDYTGAIVVLRLNSLTVGGSIISGTESGGGTLSSSGAVRVFEDIGSITVKGSLIGNIDQHVIITAGGRSTPDGTSDVVLKSLTVGGRVEFAEILAGYDDLPTPAALNADAQIGKVVVGDWIASSLVAGAQDDADPLRDDPIGNADDMKIAGGSDAIVSRIASITIRNSAFGTLANDLPTMSDHYGFVAQDIGSLKIGTATFTFEPGPGNDLDPIPVARSLDLRVREVAL